MKSTAPTTVRLRKNLARQLRGGHPWVFADAITAPALPTGTVVDVLGEDGLFVGRGLLDSRSPIAVRILTLDEGEVVDGGLVERRLLAALRARRGVIDHAETDAFRWCNGEGDRLPGVVVDLYGSTAVIRLDGDAVRTLLPWVIEAILGLGRALGVERIYERSRGGKGVAHVGGAPPPIVEVRECGIRLGVDIVHGQKTGTFLDQRENRRAIRPHARGVEVANIFSYTGGFSLHAVGAGATRVTSVDSAPGAIEAARDNFALNGFDPTRHEFVCADAFDWLAMVADAGRRFGLVIVDPPSFAPSEKALSAAISSYRRLFQMGLAIVEPGGVLAAASCSSHLGNERFLAILGESAAQANRPLRLLEVRGQPGDHPSLPAFPEGRYLKFALARAD